MALPKKEEFRLKNVIDLGTKGRFGPGREADFVKAANEDEFHHAVSRGAIEYPLPQVNSSPDTSVATGKDAPKVDKDEPEFEGTGEWRTVDGGNGWWRIINPEGKFITNKREDEAKAYVAEKNGEETPESEEE